MKFNTKELIKSPLNYTGGKYKLLPQILPLIPDKIDRFVDLFAGGCNVGVNVKANKVICNDIESHVIDMMKSLKQNNPSISLEVLKDTIGKYSLSKTNEEGFKAIRSDYNNGQQEWYMFYAMLTHAFNYQIRFNNKGEYNMPFGRDRSSFNPSLEKKFVAFVDAIHNMNISFTNVDYKTLPLDKLNGDDLVYCDPPYLISCASYNEKDGWNEDKERELLHMLDQLNNKGVRFALSNVLEDKGKSNDILKEWSKKYKVHHLNHSYSNCNYHAKNKSNNITDEVLITNY